MRSSFSSRFADVIVRGVSAANFCVAAHAATSASGRYASSALPRPVQYAGRMATGRATIAARGTRTRSGAPSPSRRRPSYSGRPRPPSTGVSLGEMVYRRVNTESTHIATSALATKPAKTRNSRNWIVSHRFVSCDFVCFVVFVVYARFAFVPADGHELSYDLIALGETMIALAPAPGTSLRTAPHLL